MRDSAKDPTLATAASAVAGVIVGALARLDDDCRPAVLQRIAALPGISAFEIEADPEGARRVGLLIEADSLDDARARLQCDVLAIPGVLAAWPVAVEVDVDAEPAGPGGCR